MTRIGIIYLLLFSFLVENTKAQETTNKIFRIGFSQCTNSDLWRKTMYMEMQNELISYPKLEFVFTDAKNRSTKQIADIKELLNSNIDLLIVSPNESEPLTQIVSETYRKGIPVIVIDRKIESSDYTAFIGGNNVRIGHEAGKYAAKLLKGKGKIAEIWGLKGSSPAKERHAGFIEELVAFPDIEIINNQSGEWEKSGGEKVMNQLLQSDTKFDLVFAHNDVMAIGAYKAFKAKNVKKRVYFIGIDGTSGVGGGIEAVLNNTLDATILYPSGGSQAIVLAWNILNRNSYLKENELNTIVIDSSNVKAMKAQTDEILTLHRKIEFSQQNLESQVQRFNSQRFQLIISLISLLTVIILVFLLLSAFRNKAIANHKLEYQKQEISKQNQELKRISQELEEATNAKLKFFTNISHEFRTPLTLILGPLETILQSTKLPAELKPRMFMMQRNATRLLRLINQLMDLRKIESEKMKLNAGNYNIVSFLSEIKNSFNELAENKQINYIFSSEIKEQLILFDKDKVDKIFFNLLSNAFKFTGACGQITISIKNTQHTFVRNECNAVEITVNDNGTGISDAFITRIFEPFYQEEQSGGSTFQGTGIGLSLSKSFVELHKGEILVKSKKGEGTTFYVYFQHGNKHLTKEDIVLSDLEYNRTAKDIIPAQEVEIWGTSKNEKNLTQNFENVLVVLIVEDIADVREFIKDCLIGNYKIVEAGNGKEAFEKIDNEEPDLIICDVMMPVMDGLEFTRKLKSDVRICHIPVILLTARSSHEQKIEGLETGADSYMPKPFNSKHLQVRVKKLIENRQKMRKHYQENLLSPVVSDSKISQLDSVFLKKCNAMIENNLTNSEYGVEELSNDVGLSRVHVYRKIKHLTDLSVSEFIRNIKLKKAALMLIDSGKSISEIAYETGFSSPSYFSKCFKDYFKVSPSEYVQTK